VLRSGSPTEAGHEMAAFIAGAKNGDFDHLLD
jgi:hypothetical protein